MLLINHQGIVEFFNTAAEKLWGYSQAEVIGQNIKMLMPEKYASIHDEKIQNYIQTGVKHVIDKGREVPVLQKDGTEAEVYLTVAELNMNNNHKFAGFVKDLSELKRKENERNQLTEQIIAKEFEYQAKIEKLEEILFENNIELPDDFLEIEEKN